MLFFSILCPSNVVFDVFEVRLHVTVITVELEMDHEWGTGVNKCTKVM